MADKWRCLQLFQPARQRLCRMAGKWLKCNRIWIDIAVFPWLAPHVPRKGTQGVPSVPAGATYAGLRRRVCRVRAKRGLQQLPWSQDSVEEISGLPIVLTVGEAAGLRGKQTRPSLPGFANGGLGKIRSCAKFAQAVSKATGGALLTAARAAKVATQCCLVELKLAQSVYRGCEWRKLVGLDLSC